MSSLDRPVTQGSSFHAGFCLLLDSSVALPDGLFQLFSEVDWTVGTLAMSSGLSFGFDWMDGSAVFCGSEVGFGSVYSEKSELLMQWSLNSSDRFPVSIHWSSADPFQNGTGVQLDRDS
ncbi:hypothetical protein ILYODFUR_013823 [Ilyodon furcidens]|uniref:Uncharacterized protein n=1 Tax=Ilyodon furcidens TaxID=33524 RepID=A0ABV0V2U2_9TELE